MSKLVTIAFDPESKDLLQRVAEAFERIAPQPRPSGLDQVAEGYLWLARERRLTAIEKISRVELDLLRRVEQQREALLANTRSFAFGRPANNALLWGARGTGKSSLVKAVHASVNDARETGASPIALVDIQREDIATLPDLLALLQAEPERRFILFCDDLSFDAGDAAYMSMKAVLDGGIAGRPDNVLIYATSNRRHILARDMIENERSTAINPGEAVDEKVSLSDRFGLWLGFYAIDQDGYLEMVCNYAERLSLPFEREELRRRALEWAMQRASRSGRTAWQFLQSLGVDRTQEPGPSQGRATA